ISSLWIDRDCGFIRLSMLNRWLRANALLAALVFWELVFASARPPEEAGRSSSTVAALDPVRLATMDAAINQAIHEGRCPGGVLWVEHGPVAYHRAFGRRAVIPEPEEMTEDTV